MHFHLKMHENRLFVSKKGFQFRNIERNLKICFGDDLFNGIFDVFFKFIICEIIIWIETI